MNKKIFIIISAIYILIYGILMCLDLYDIVLHKKEIVFMYNISYAAPHWQFECIENLIIRNVLWIIYYAINLCIYVFFVFKKPSRKFLIYLITNSIAISLLTFRYYFLWRLSGYDHYPGFDPYIL